MVGTLSQSDYRWGPSANQITGARTGVVCTVVARNEVAHTGFVHARVEGTLSQSVEPIRVAHAVVVHAEVMCTGVVHARVEGTLSQSVEPIRVVHTVVVHTGVAHAEVVCTGVVHAGVMCTEVACTGVACTEVACARVEGTLSQSVKPIRVACAGLHAQGLQQGGGDTQPIGAANNGCICKGCMHKGGGDTQPIRVARAKGCMHRGYACRGCMRTRLEETLSQSVEPIRVAQGLCAGVVHSNQGVGDISQSVEPIRVVCSRGCVPKGGFCIGWLID